MGEERIEEIKAIIRRMLDERFNGSMEGDSSYDVYVENAAQEIVELFNY